MTSEEQRLAAALRIKFGTSLFEPNAAQINNIVRGIQKINSSGRVPNDSDWELLVKNLCPSYGSHFYSGVDNSDLNVLLHLVTKNR